jgi:hypothetical protein
MHGAVAAAGQDGVEAVSNRLPGVDGGAARRIGDEGLSLHARGAQHIQNLLHRRLAARGVLAGSRVIDQRNTAHVASFTSSAQPLESRILES